MSYSTTSIARMIKDIDHSRVFLPALQRKFVWGRHQIVMLFDSLMRNYPFGTFLFWRLHRQKADHYVFYEFLQNFDVRNPFNKRKTGAFTHEEITGVLDGQQRLSSMYVGLMGSHIEKAPYKHWSNPQAFEKMWLHLDLLNLPYEIGADRKLLEVEDQDYPFEFLTAEAAARPTVRREMPGVQGTVETPALWFRIGEVMSWSDEPDFEHIVDLLEDRATTSGQKDALRANRRLVRKGLETLFDRICHRELINYFEVAKENLEDILKIFVRVNSGGTVLTKTDLLFSTIVATWENGREEIEDLERALNAIGDGFNFGNEYLMRACLMLTDSPILFNVRSFKSANVARIRDEWPRISASLKKTVEFLADLGFSGATLTSHNATLPIAYYLHKGGQLDASSREGLRQYLLRSLLLGVYGSTQDQVLNTFRNALRMEDADGRITLKSAAFDFSAVEKLSLPHGRTLAVSHEDIDRMLESTKGFGGFSVLSLLYPQLRFSQVSFHQDHIHPHSGFSTGAFTALGLEPEEQAEWHAMRDRVPNLQLLEGKTNQSKNAQPLAGWLSALNDREMDAFRSTHYLPQEVDLDFSSFRKFYDARRSILKDRLAILLSANA